MTTKELKHTLILSKFGNTQYIGSQNAKIKRCGICNIITIRKSYTFEKAKTFIKNRNLSCNSKNVVNTIQCTNCKQIYIGCTQ